MTKKIRKILIANRGEIACRVMKTARRMGIQTVAVYSDADKKALHTRTADEAVHIGASPAAESYLVIDKIIGACKQTGADAVHPGYGFLSENPEFARRLKAEGITFIGPSPQSMEAMGLKDAAKKLMAEAGVPVTPGYHGADQTPSVLKAEADSIGYPVLIKAVAGGGGKGMRKVDRADDFISALESCQREAKSSFGKDRVLIEKYITSPRHIEVQVFGDTHGNVVHMFERDCSLQRRHQKVIEEAPAPGMTQDVREAMTSAAVQAAKAVDYVGAGTVEFIVDGSGALKTDGFWFMEMNTRLQVEHPVTEMITGLDLVELQIRVAQGETLPKQGDIAIEGHAIEARLYAEDPANDFLPSVGRIKGLDPEPYQDSEGGFRIDTGVMMRDEVTVFYDPMISKIIGYGNDRDIAIENTVFGITEIEVYPLITNASFLISCLQNKSFAKGAVSTHFIERESVNDLIPVDIRKVDEVFALAALRLEDDQKDGSRSPYQDTSGFRLNMSSRRVWTFLRDCEAVDVTILKKTLEFADVQVGEGNAIRIDMPKTIGIDTVSKGLRNYSEWNFKVTKDYVSLTSRANFAQVYFYRPEAESLLTSGNVISSPMPGKIIAVNASAGDTVKAGDPLIIMEAMKMEMTLEAPRDGVVAAVKTESGALVSDGDVLLEMEDAE